MSEPRTTMNGKPLLERQAKTIVNFESGFGHKLLCDGLTFNTGDACPFTCSFCYVPAMSHKLLHEQLEEAHLKHEQVVIRRTDAVEKLREQLLAVREGHGKKAALFKKRDRPLVIYSSTNSDVAANKDLCDETIAACWTILNETPWDIRLLSKSHLLPRIAAAIPENHVHRVIFGVSTGTLNDKLAKAFEQGTPLVSKRIESLHWLQDNGYRTFGMICPSLPTVEGTTESYQRFAQQMHAALRADKLEHVWAEVINVRGESMTRTLNALIEGGFEAEASALAKVSTDKKAWEDYSLNTFLAHATFYRMGQLRYLQYVNPNNLAVWSRHVPFGAVLLGKAAADHAATEQ